MNDKKWNSRQATVEERFFHKVKKTETCWLWTGAKCGSPYHYGAFSINNKPVRAHRFAYTHFVGPIPPGQIVCHHCDIPLCVNPLHLFAGTLKDNIQDSMKKGRFRPIGYVYPPPWNGRLTHCQRGHEFTPENSYRDKNKMQRWCLVCMKARQQAARERKRLRKLIDIMKVDNP